MADSGPISKHDIKLALGGMRFDKDINVGWQITPSIGIVAKDIDRMALALSSFKEPLERSIKQVMIPSFQKNFEVGGRPEKWEPLASYTLEVRAKQGAGNKILVRTGALKRGVAQFSIWNVGNTSATIRGLPDSIWYGAIHQQGIGGFGPFVEAAQRSLGRRAGGLAVIKEAFRLLDEARGAGGHRAVHIPQRRFIVFQEEDIDDIQQVFLEWMIEQTIIHGRFTR
jgi:phage gpG-like protein